jgi:sigma-B regulation protein RsbU (phosphoserine phosphatase)
VELCSGGHEPPYLLRADGGVERIALPHNLALGIEPDWEDFAVGELTLATGDQLLVYTDGLTEAENGRRELFGRERLEALLRGPGAPPPPSTLLGNIVDAVRAFEHGAPQTDDLTLFSLAYLGAPGAAQRFESRVPYDLQRMADTLAEFEAFCGGRNIPREEFFPVLLCVEEVLGNILTHSALADDASDRTVHFCATLAGERIELEFRDQGAEFNPLLHPEPELADTAEARPVGGLGIFLTRKHMDRMDYERVGDTNVLRLSRPVHHIK